MPRRALLLSALLAIPLCTAALSLPACSTAQYADDALPDGAFPSDFWIAVTVMGPLREGGAAALPRSQRPGRYIIEADWILRAALGPGARPDVFPAQTRQLTQAQMYDLWRLLQSTGLSNTESPLRSFLEPDAKALAGRTVYIVVWHARGRHRTLLIEGESGDPQAIAEARKITDAIAALAWIPE